MGKQGRGSSRDKDEEEQALQAATLAISAARRCVVFSGAGASADSGIDTFRGNGGAWSGITGRFSLLWGGTPIGWRLTPGLVWSSFVTNFYGPIVKARPHDGLFALAELQKRRFGRRMEFITMNVDGLHQASGSEGVAEVHGSVRRFRCSECSEPHDPEMPLDPDSQPHCTEDGCEGLIRPDVTLFTESLPGDQWEAAEQAVESLQAGDVMIIVGTSSVVYPAADLPSMAKAQGATLLEFNLELPTPLSSIVDIAVKGKAASTLRQVVDRVLGTQPGRERQPCC